MKRLIYPALVLVLVMALGTLLVPAGGVSAATSMRLTRTYVAPGDSVTAQVFGFTPQDDVVFAVTVRVANNQQRVSTSATADASGSATATLTIPKGTAQATYTVIARDFHGHQVSHNLTVFPLAYLAANGKTYTVYVIPQHALLVSGGGFQPGETVNLSASFPLYDGNTSVFNKSVQASSKGTFYEVFVRVPRNAKVGLTSITATGATSKKAGKNTIRVIYRPFLLSAGTVRPGTGVNVRGREFVPNSTVRVNVTIGRNGGTNLTLSRSITTDANGAFAVTLGLPSNVRAGKYSISAVDSVGGFKAFSSVLVSVHPTIALQPATVLPGQTFTVSGDNFGSGVTLTVSATFPLQGGGSKNVSSAVRTGGAGNYAVQLTAPGSAAPGRVNVTAQSANAHVSTQVVVKQRPAAPAPTATPVPTSAPPTATPTTSKKHGHHHAFAVRYISIWYHVVRVGTYDVIVAQSTLHTTLGIWVHVWFPSGQGNLAWYQNTDPTGHWQMKFAVPTYALNSSNNHVLVTFRFWHGKASVKEFGGFSLVR